jgi:hypothetical protein
MIPDSFERCNGLIQSVPFLLEMDEDCIEVTHGKDYRRQNLLNEVWSNGAHPCTV